MKQTPSAIGRVLRAATGLLLPVVLILTNVRLLLTPAFVSLEYAMPGFPPDPYGFSPEERTRQALHALAFVVREVPPSALGDLRDEAGSVLYNERELQHMVDVQVLVLRALAAWKASLVLFALAAVGTWRQAGSAAVIGGLRSGARLTVLGMTVLIAVLALSFSALFVGFHNVFFESGTWLFYPSDTLIRLFPVRFWRDAFALLLFLTLGEAGLLLGVVRVLRRRPGVDRS